MSHFDLIRLSSALSSRQSRWPIPVRLLPLRLPPGSGYRGTCGPSPCGRLSRPRTTTKAPLPCRIFSVIFLGVLILEIFHLAALRIAGRFRRSGLGNLQLDTLGKAYCDVGVGFRPFPLIAAGCHKYRAVCVYLSHSAMTYGEYNHPAPPGRVSRLGLPLKQFSLVPRSQCCVLPLSRG